VVGLGWYPCCNTDTTAHNAFMCSAWISEQTAIISLYSINLSGFITEAEFTLRYELGL